MKTYTKKTTRTVPSGIPKYRWTDRLRSGEDQKRFDSGVWKCDKSPTGAHFYTLDSAGQGSCKYCDKEH